MNLIVKLFFLLQLVLTLTGEVCAQEPSPLLFQKAKAIMPTTASDKARAKTLYKDLLAEQKKGKGWFSGDIGQSDELQKLVKTYGTIELQHLASMMSLNKDKVDSHVMAAVIDEMKTRKIQNIKPKTPASTSQKNEEPVQISADHIIQGTAKDSILAWGRVKLKHQDRTLWADKVMVNNKTGIGKARGHVILVTSDGTRMKARETLFDLKSKKGKLYKSKGILTKKFRITGKEIERLSTNHFILDDASLTTCKGVLPAWKIQAKSADIISGDRALFNEAIIKVKNFPILYIPLGYIPINRERKSGFLVPSFGWSDIEGVLFQEEFFWAINRWSDATYKTKRLLGGWQHSLDYRYIASETEKGKIIGKFYKDNITGDSLWKVGMHHLQKLPNDFEFKGTLDLESQNSLNQIVNNNTEERTRRHTDSYASVNRTWDNQSLDIIARYRQSTESINDDTLGELPKVTYKVQKIPIGKTPFYFNLDTSLAWFVTDLKTGVDDDYFFKTSRVDFHPQLTLPIPIAPWLSLTHTLGARETFYGRGLVNDYEAGGEIGGFKKLPSFTRESLNLSSTLKGPKFNKIFHFDKSSTKIKHILGPQFTHSYIPDIDEEDRLKIKSFDGIDGIYPANRITYGFEQILLKKLKVRESEFETKRILRFNVSQTYDIREATIEKKSGADRLPFSNLRFDLDSRLLDSTILNVDATYNLETDLVNSFNFEAGIKPVDNLWIIMERRWTRDSSNYILGTLDFSFNPGWRVQYSTRFDELTATFRENNFSLLYDNPCKCWGFKFDIIDRQVREINNKRRDQTQYLFTIKLRGLGELRNRSVGMFLHRDFEDTSFPKTDFESKLMRETDF